MWEFPEAYHEGFSDDIFQVIHAEVYEWVPRCVLELTYKTIRWRLVGKNHQKQKKTFLEIIGDIPERNSWGTHEKVPEFS